MQAMASTEKQLRFGTPGDYRPMAYRDPRTGAYSGFDIELAGRLAAELGCQPVFMATSWASLSRDARADAFDMAIGGISRTAEREAELILSDGYLETGKTILCRRGEEARYTDLASVDRPGVCVLYNPGGTNEAFVRTRLLRADCCVFPQNEVIPGRIRAGVADIMITETVEAAYYTRHYPGLAAPLMAEPFTRGTFCIAMGRSQSAMAGVVNEILADFRSRGVMHRLAERYL